MRPTLLAVLFASLPALAADQIVNEQPSPADVDRFTIVRDGDTTLKLDTRTGASWVQCASKKQKPKWCALKDRAPYPAGPVGRYRVVTGTQPLMMLDTVSGRAFSRCEDVTPEKTFAWCPIAEE